MCVCVCVYVCVCVCVCVCLCVCVCVCVCEFVVSPQLETHFSLCLLMIYIPGRNLFPVPKTSPQQVLPISESPTMLALPPPGPQGYPSMDDRVVSSLPLPTSHTTIGDELVRVFISNLRKTRHF